MGSACELLSRVCVCPRVVVVVVGFRGHRYLQDLDLYLSRRRKAHTQSVSLPRRCKCGCIIAEVTARLCNACSTVVPGANELVTRFLDQHVEMCDQYRTDDAKSPADLMIDIARRCINDGRLALDRAHRLVLLGRNGVCVCVCCTLVCIRVTSEVVLCVCVFRVREKLPAEPAAHADQFASRLVQAAKHRVAVAESGHRRLAAPQRRGLA